jgi:hypothetical protein
MYPYSNPSIITKSLTALKNIKWATLLDGTQKTLGVINQAIPIVYQVKPLVNNAKTLFKIANVIKEPVQNNNEVKKIKKETNTSPIFYI